MLYLHYNDVFISVSSYVYENLKLKKSNIG